MPEETKEKAATPLEKEKLEYLKYCTEIICNSTIKLQEQFHQNSNFSPRRAIKKELETWSNRMMDKVVQALNSI